MKNVFRKSMSRSKKQGTISRNKTIRMGQDNVQDTNSSASPKENRWSKRLTKRLTIRATSSSPKTPPCVRNFVTSPTAVHSTPVIDKEIPPPPPLPMRPSDTNESTEYLAKSKASLETDSPPPAGEEEIDFAIVPLLLRSQMAYGDASAFGDLLRMKDADTLCEIQKSPASFLHALKELGWVSETTGVIRGVDDSNLFMEKLSSDVFWRTQHSSSSGCRQSLVYYRRSSLTKQQKAQKHRDQEARQRSAARRSTKKTFQEPQTPVGTEQASEAEIDEARKLVRKITGVTI